MFAKTITAITAAKTVRLFLRIFGGGATAAPGLIAERIDPTILSRLTSRLPKKVIITGTNGKTTTSRILSTILSFNGIKTIHNREGSNLTRGIVSTLIEKSNLLASSEADIGVFEVDEATLPEAVSKINPDVIVINNLFRDQLDRYGDVDKINTPQGRFDISAQIPGLYNLYNIIAAVTAAISLGIKVENIEKSLRDYKSAFGRAEKLEINDKSIFVFLAKNPTGFN